jgi:hypothetical protein
VAAILDVSSSMGTAKPPVVTYFARSKEEHLSVLHIFFTDVQLMSLAQVGKLFPPEKAMKTDKE